MKKHSIHLTIRERARLVTLLGVETESPRVLRRAQILLLSDDGMTDDAIARVTRASIPTIERTRSKFAAGGLARAIRDRPRDREPRKFDLYLAGRLAGLMRGRPPTGRARWTLKLLAKELVRRGIVESISHESVRRALACSGAREGIDKRSLDHPPKA